MAIYELEPRVKIGPFEMGLKIGERIDQSVNGVSIEEHDWEHGATRNLIEDPDGNIRKISLSGREKRYREVEPTFWGKYSGTVALVVGSSTVLPIYWSDNDIFGYVQTEGRPLIGQQINDDPVVGRRLRYIPD